MDRASRQAVVRELIRRGQISRQDELRGALAERGVLVTQATLSRDLRALGVVKGAHGYVLPEPGLGRGSAAGGVSPRANGSGRSSNGRSIEIAPMLAEALRRHLVSLDIGAAMVVLKTPPGHAQALAVELDHAPPPGAIGTVAGDDTIFVACRSSSAAGTLGAELQAAAGAGESKAVEQ